MEHIKSIRILGHDYKLIMDETLIRVHGNRGECRHNVSEIAIDSNLPKSLIAQTIFHEIMEALVQQLDIKIEHSAINQFDAGFTQVFQDNPELKKIFFGGK